MDKASETTAEEFHLRIAGDVQGVSFRYYAWQEANRLGLAGFVRNLPGGEVEIIAQGSKENLEKLIDWVSRGPRFAQVEKVAVKRQKTQQRFQSFEISY
jgi:acylphosphatase